MTQHFQEKQLFALSCRVIFLTPCVPTEREMYRHNDIVSVGIDVLYTLYEIGQTSLDAWYGQKKTVRQSMGANVLSAIGAPPPVPNWSV